MPKGGQFVSETNIQNEKVYEPLLASIEGALRNEPAAAHAFAALMWMVGDAARKGRGRVFITKIVNASINVAYEHTSDHRDDHQTALERFKRVLADECDAKSDRSAINSQWIAAPAFNVRQAVSAEG
jgi:hypothetical protein